MRVLSLGLRNLLLPALLLVVFPAPLFALDFFDASREFPNYFIKEEFRALKWDEIPEHEANRALKRLEQALYSVFQRLTIPVMLEGRDRPVRVRYFSFAKDILGKIDPKVKVMPSGGVVRSAIGYVYDEIAARLETGTAATADEAIAQIIGNALDIDATEVRGVGSDFDVLIKSPSGKIRELKEELSRVTNSVEQKTIGLRADSGAQRFLFNIADCKDYGEQIGLASRQGGSTIDMLAFDTDEGELLNPDRFPGISKDLARGVYDYAAPVQVISDPEKQTIRGMRPRLELPWMTLKDDSILRRELVMLLKKAEQGKEVSAEAVKQIGKMIRNARFQGAHNRFYRAREGSLDRLFMDLVGKLQQRTESALIPEFVAYRPLSSAPRKPLPKNLLVPIDQFIAKSTDAGKLYHGTPRLENAFAIMRQGLFMSKDGQGLAAYGPGAYSSPHRDMASGYAGKKGVVLTLEALNDPNIRIVDWDRDKDHPVFTKLQRRASKSGLHVFDLLAQEYAVDVIVHHHVLVRNVAAIRYKGRNQFVDLHSRLREIVMDSAQPLRNRLHFLTELEALSAYIWLLGRQVEMVPNELVRQMVHAAFAVSFEEDFAAYSKNANLPPSMLKNIQLAGHANTRMSALRILKSVLEGESMLLEREEAQRLILDLSAKKPDFRLASGIAEMFLKSESVDLQPDTRRQIIMNLFRADYGDHWSYVIDELIQVMPKDSHALLSETLTEALLQARKTYEITDLLQWVSRLDPNVRVAILERLAKEGPMGLCRVVAMNLLVGAQMPLSDPSLQRILMKMLERDFPEHSEAERLAFRMMIVDGIAQTGSRELEPVLAQVARSSRSGKLRSASRRHLESAKPETTDCARYLRVE